MKRQKLTDRFPLWSVLDMVWEITPEIWFILQSAHSCWLLFKCGRSECSSCSRNYCNIKFFDGSQILLWGTL